MKLCYAMRRGVFYPGMQDQFGTMPEKEHRPGYLKLVKSFGFDGVEIPTPGQGDLDSGKTRDFAKELKDAGLPPACVRAGGPVAHHTAGPEARERLDRAAFKEWAWHPQLVIEESRTYRRREPG